MAHLPVEYGPLSRIHARLLRWQRDGAWHWLLPRYEATVLVAAISEGYDPVSRVIT